MSGKMAETDPVAVLVQRYSAGEADARDALFGMIYDDLRRRAQRLSHGPDATLSTTALVHETWLRLAGAKLSLADKAHFFRVAARAMRHVLIDASRRNKALKRGAGEAPLPLDTSPLIAPDRPLNVVALEDAMEHLSVAEPRLARVVELHFYGGLGFAEIGQMLDLSERTVARDWRAARALLQLSMREADGGTENPVRTS